MKPLKSESCRESVFEDVGSFFLKEGKSWLELLFFLQHL